MWSKGRLHLAGTAREPGPGRSLVAAERAIFTASRLSPLNLVVLVRLAGPAVDGLLPRALAAVSERHPLLRARIVGSPGRPRFEIVSPAAGRDEPTPIPLQTLRANDSEHAFAVAEAEMNTPFDPAADPLARLTCMTGPGPDTDLIFTLHHAIADGASAANLVHELLDWCRSALSGEAAPPSVRAVGVPASMPPPLTDLLPARMRGLPGACRRLTLAGREGRDEIAYRLHTRGRRRPVPAAGRAACRPVALDRGDTAALISQGRRQRFTLTSLMAAGLLWQASTVLYGGRPGTMRAVIWVDLRPYLDPPVGGETLGCYISLLRFPIRVDQRRGFPALATGVQRAIERASRRGDRLPAAQLSAAMTRFAVRWPVARLGTVALSHAETSAIRPAYGPLVVREVRAFVSNNRIGAELAAASGVRQGRLWCDLLYLDSDYGETTAAALGDGLLSTLREYGGQA